jgi:hypothetical protein
MSVNSRQQQSTAIAALGFFTILWALPHIAVGAGLIFAKGNLIRVRNDSPQGFGSILALFDQSPYLIGTAFLLQAALAVLAAWGLFHRKAWSVPLMLLLVGAAFIWGVEWLFAANQAISDRATFHDPSEPSDNYLTAFGLAQLAYGALASITMLGFGQSLLHQSRSSRRRNRSHRNPSAPAAPLASDASMQLELPNDQGQKIKRTEPYHRF